MVYWKDEYSLGVEFIDEQHKRLFELAGEIYDLLKNEFYVDKYHRIVNLLEELGNYAVFHFQAEEAYQKEIGYKKFLSHKVEHDDFVAKFENIDLKTIDENQDSFILELLDYVVNWIGDHILLRDKDIITNK